MEHSDPLGRLTELFIEAHRQIKEKVLSPAEVERLVLLMECLISGNSLINVADASLPPLKLSEIDSGVLWEAFLRQELLTTRCRTVLRRIASSLRELVEVLSTEPLSHFLNIGKQTEGLIIEALAAYGLRPRMSMEAIAVVFAPSVTPPSAGS